jgi:outer membrane protein with beta-barrel domain
MPPVRCRRLFASAILIVGIAAGCTRTLARDTEKSWEVEPYVLVGRYANAADIDTGFGYGVRGGYHVKAIHELELSLDWVSADDTELPGVTIDVSQYSFDYARIFLIKGHDKMTPFASFGLGIINVDDGTESASSTSYRVGGGFKYYWQPRFALRFDVKVYRWHGNGHVTTSDPFFSMNVGLGVSFLFGGTK